MVAGGERPLLQRHRFLRRRTKPRGNAAASATHAMSDLRVPSFLRALVGPVPTRSPTCCARRLLSLSPTTTPPMLARPDHRTRLLWPSGQSVRLDIESWRAGSWEASAREGARLTARPSSRPRPAPRCGALPPHHSPQRQGNQDHSRYRPAAAAAADMRPRHYLSLRLPSIAAGSSSPSSARRRPSRAG